MYIDKTLSCADLSESIGKSVPLVTKVVNELVQSGQVVENGLAPSSGGRRPVMFSLKADFGFIVTVAMDQLFTKITILDFNNDPVLPVETRELKLSNNPKALFELVEYINDIITRSGVEREKIIGVGIGMPGFINTKLGVTPLAVAAGIGWVEGVTRERSTAETVEAVKYLLSLGIESKTFEEQLQKKLALKFLSDAADESGSTDYIRRAIEAATEPTTFAIGTEVNLVQRLAADNPQHTIFCLDPVVCPCSTMYRIHPGYLAWVLEGLVDGEVRNRITVPADVADPARLALERMLAAKPPAAPAAAWENAS